MRKQTSESGRATGVAVVGGQWGDEGKGKIIDLLAGSVDVVARFQGGPNAGHTVQAEGQRLKLHHIPSGILHPETHCVIGNGVVILPESLREEMRVLEEAGIQLQGRLHISSRAHLILPIHVTRDAATEESGERIGTTLRGVGPAYVSKYGRFGVRVEDLLDETRLRERVAIAARPEGLDGVDATVGSLLEFGAFLAPYVTDTVVMLNDRLDDGAVVLFEGAQGTMLDIDHGGYPFVTSSNSCATGICAGLGVGPTRIGTVVGVMKAYGTRVGEGPMPTELIDATGERLRERGKEYGTTTGRPRRCGWFDGVVARHAVRVNNLDSVALTLFDVLDDFDTVRICKAYRYRGEILDGMPLESWALKDVEPVYVDLPGWRKDTTGARRFSDLPPEAKEVVRHLEEIVQCDVGLVSVGPDRAQSILREGSRLAGLFPSLLQNPG